jgi:hypothetical protein
MYEILFNNEQKYMEILGEDTKELDYNQFCTLLNETRNSNPSRYSSFLNKRHLSGAVQFFKLLEEDEGEIMVNMEEEEPKKVSKPEAEASSPHAPSPEPAHEESKKVA